MLALRRDCRYRCLAKARSLCWRASVAKANESGPHNDFSKSYFLTYCEK